MAQKLIARGASVGMALYAAATSDNLGAMKLLLSLAKKKTFNILIQKNAQF